MSNGNGDGGGRRGSGSREEDTGWYGPSHRRSDLGDRRGSGTLSGSDIGIFRPDYRMVTPYRWERRRQRRAWNRAIAPYYYQWNPYPYGYYYAPRPRYHQYHYPTTRGWFNWWW